MKMNKATSVEDYKIVSSFQSLRNTLLDEKFADRLEKPLAYWAMPNDRRLPLAFLGRTIKDLLATPFEELSATPGIGQKKISSLVKLLSRATKDQPPIAPFGITDLAESRKPQIEKPRRNEKNFDPAIVSEALWAEWRETVRQHGLEREKLGRLAPTLQALPTVIWHTPLGQYADYTVAEIRQLKTHGEKRIRVILEVFFVVHEAFSGVTLPHYLQARLVPTFVQSIEAWIASVLSASEMPSLDELKDQLVSPLLEQILVDAGPTIHDLSASRLGMGQLPQSVRHQARAMGLTRARVYQLLEECAKVMAVRWPEGEQQFAALYAKLKHEATHPEVLRAFQATCELFFPGKKKLSDEENHQPALTAV